MLGVDDSTGLETRRLQVNSSGQLLVSTTGSSSLVVGTTTITSGTSTRILYDNAGVLGEYTLTGTGTVVVMATAPTITSPTLATLPVLGDAALIKYTIPTVDGTATGVMTDQFNSGYTSSAVGDLVYLDSSGTWQKADADASATTYSSGPLGIALEVKASAAALKVLLEGYIYAASPFPTFTIGAPVYMSATAGAVTQTAPSATDSATRILGHAVHADKMWFSPSNDWITHT